MLLAILVAGAIGLWPASAWLTYLMIRRAVLRAEGCWLPGDRQLAWLVAGFFGPAGTVFFGLAWLVWGRDR